MPGSAPTDGSAVGELAEGFPSSLLPVPDGAEVLVSTADPAPEAGLVVVSLNLRSTRETADLLAAVESPLLAAGFTRADAPADETALAARSALSGPGDQWVIIGILDTGDGRTLTLSGQVRRDDP